MSVHLREARERVREWERHHVAKVPAPWLSTTLKRRSLEHRVAGVITDFAGSMTFVYIHTVWFGLWVVVNTGGLRVIGIDPFDPFPFGLLTLIVSLEAIFLATFVMIAQNRLSAASDARAQADYEVNVRAEAEIAKLLHLMESLVEHHLSLTTEESEP